MGNIRELTPVVFVKDGGARTDSRFVAEFFEKRHDNVLRDIRRLIEVEPSLGLLNFEEFKIKDLTGETTSHYTMDRDGFTLLAMGFTGEKALAWKVQYIGVFNKMEAEIKRLAAPAVPKTFADALRLAADQQDEIARLTPRAAAHDRTAA